MTATSLVLTGRYHLGDNPGLFQDATFVGYVLALPLVVSVNRDEADAEAAFHIETHDIETWDPDSWLGHCVRLTGPGGGCDLGRLRDPDGAVGRVETFRLTIAISKLREVLGGQSGSVVLTIEVEKQHAKPGLSDDFVLTRLEAAGLTARVGA